MSVYSFYRTALSDRIILGGWILLAIIGQTVFSTEVNVLEWAAVGWMASGLWIVRSSACLPLLILTGPLFMCAPPHPWSWAIPTGAVIFLVRLLTEKRCGRKELLWIVFWGTLMLAFSWPRDSGRLLLELRAYGLREVLIQSIRPEASWAIFAFRHSLDRALVVALATALVLIPGYFKTSRIWQSLLGAGLLAVGATYGATLLPWQQPHGYLGSLNNSAAPGFLFFGGGYNPCYLAFILAVTIPCFFVPLSPRHPWIHLGLIPLFIPTLFVNERVFTLALIAIGLMFMLLATQALTSPKRRVRFRSHVQACFRQHQAILNLACLSMIIAGLWSFRSGILDSQSQLRATIRACAGKTESVWVKEMPYGEPAQTRLLKPEAAGELVQPTLSFFDRLELRLSQFDPARANMWAMGLKHAWHNGLIRGSGAGTWARFHREHRITRLYFEHMHNVFLNLVFEYGIIPMGTLYLISAALLFRLLRGVSGLPRVWLLWFAGMAGIGMGFDLFYFPLTLFGILLLALIILAKTSRITASGKPAPTR